MSNHETMFIQALSRSLDNLPKKYADRLPEDYLDIQASLIKNETTSGQTSLTIFHGGPLNYRHLGIEDAWLTPICFFRQLKHRELKMANYHLISINCRGLDDLINARVYFNLSTDDELKLSSEEPTAQSQALTNFIVAGTKEKIVIIRYSAIGSLAFPLMSYPELVRSQSDYSRQMSAKFIVNGFLTILEQLYLGSAPDDLLFRTKQLVEKTRLYFKTKLFSSVRVTYSQELMTPYGKVFITNFVSKNTVWRLYRAYSLKPLEMFDRDQEVLIRIDSGCDIGMLYGDAGCDCHGQLLSALQPTDEHDALVIHIPHQDGRGYGCNTKIHTEGLKNGLDPITKKKIKPMQTESAAEYTLGPKYDIRSYREAAEIIVALGFTKVAMLTDNSKKVWVMKMAIGEQNVRQIDTSTIQLMIKEKKNPLTVIQMVLKLTGENNYLVDDAHGILMNVINYLGYKGISPETSNETIREILKAQYEQLLVDLRPPNRTDFS